MLEIINIMINRIWPKYALVTQERARLFNRDSRMKVGTLYRVIHDDTDSMTYVEDKDGNTFWVYNEYIEKIRWNPFKSGCSICINICKSDKPCPFFESIWRNKNG